MLSRRDALRTAVSGAVLFALPRTAPTDTPPPFTLPKLPYPADALEPHIDSKTMEIHHGKHHQAYVDNLNKALGGKGDKPLEALLHHLGDVPETTRTAVRNNGGGHWNHTFFWDSMSKAGGQPAGDLLKALEASFGTLDQFKQEWKAQAVAQFGSGWAWLERTPPGGGGKPLRVSTTQNQDNPLMAGRPAPLLGLDVWEHAYYLKYQNKRADYVQAWFNVVNWDAVARRLADNGAVKPG